MSYSLKRQPAGNGIHYNVINDPKFKHNRISANLIVPLDMSTVTDYALLPFVMRKGYQGCADFSALNARLDDLYGASLSADVSKIGRYQILSISIQSIDDRFAIQKEELVKECAVTLRDMLISPNIVNGAFPQIDIELERQYLIDTIESEINDKRAYAMSRCKAIMCEGDAAAIRRYGYIDRAKLLTPQSAASSYDRLMRMAAIELCFVGSGNGDTAGDILIKGLSAMKRQPLSYAPEPMKTTAKNVNEHIEHMDVSQSKLVMGFRTGEIANIGEQNATRLMTAILGGTPFSKLFMNVREKLSLCYYCAARFDRATGILMIDSGIEGDNREKAQAEILNQLEAVKRGDFTDEELENARLSMKNSLRSVSDSPGSIDDWNLMQLVSGTGISPDEDIAALDGVTGQQVIEAAKKVSLDTVYLLTGGQNQ